MSGSDVGPLKTLGLGNARNMPTIIKPVSVIDHFLEFRNPISAARSLKR